MPDIDLTSPEATAAIEAAAKDIAAKLVDEQTAGLKANSAKLLAEKKALQERLKGLPEDFDPAEFAKLKDAEAHRQEEGKKKAGEWETLKVDLVKKHQTELERLTAERDSALRRYEEYFVDSQLIDAINKADGIAEMLMPKVRSSVKYVRGENGKGDAVLLVKPDGTLETDGKGEPLPLATLLDKLKSDDVWSRGFKSSGASGGGANGSQGGQGGAKTMKRAAFEALSPKQKMDVSRNGIALVD